MLNQNHLVNSRFSKNAILTQAYRFFFVKCHFFAYQGFRAIVVNILFEIAECHKPFILAAQTHTYSSTFAELKFIEMLLLFLLFFMGRWDQANLRGEALLGEQNSQFLCLNGVPFLLVVSLIAKGGYLWLIRLLVEHD